MAEPDDAEPLKLDPLQLKTLAILQALARVEGYADPPDAEGRVALRYLPNPHGDHFHVGRAVVSTRDAAGLANPAVYGALERKGLLSLGPGAARSSRRRGSATRRAWRSSSSSGHHETGWWGKPPRGGDFRRLGLGRIGVAEG